MLFPFLHICLISITLNYWAWVIYRLNNYVLARSQHALNLCKLIYKHAIEHPRVTSTQKCISIHSSEHQNAPLDNWQCKREDTFFVICGKYFRFEVLWVSSWNRSQKSVLFCSGGWICSSKIYDRTRSETTTEKRERNNMQMLLNRSG